jgi:hypothetical protein
MAIASSPAPDAENAGAGAKENALQIVWQRLAERLLALPTQAMW